MNKFIVATSVFASLAISSANASTVTAVFEGTIYDTYGFSEGSIGLDDVINLTLVGDTETPEIEFSLDEFFFAGYDLAEMAAYELTSMSIDVAGFGDVFFAEDVAMAVVNDIMISETELFDAIVITAAEESAVAFYGASFEADVLNSISFSDALALGLAEANTLEQVLFFDSSEADDVGGCDDEFGCSFDADVSLVDLEVEEDAPDAGNSNPILTDDPTPVPVPAPFALLFGGLVALRFLGRRKSA